MAKGKSYRSLVGGALDGYGFKPGDIITAPTDRQAREWLAAGLVRPLSSTEKAEAST